MERLIESIDVSQLTTSFVEFLPRIGVAVAILILFFVIYRVTRPLLVHALRRAAFQDALIKLLVDSIYRYTLLIFGVVMAVDQLGVNVAAAVAGIGIAGIVVGFAAQDSVANLIAGITIFWDKPFVVNDWIEVEGQYGRVSNITLRSTRIQTPRNTFVVLPNKAIVDAVLENYTKHGVIRLDVPLGIAYKEKIAEARDVLLAAVRELPMVLDSPPPDVVAKQLGNSSVDLHVRIWIDDGKLKEPATSAVIEASKVALDEAGIEIPFPHLQLFVEDVRERVWKRATELAGSR